MELPVWEVMLRILLSAVLGGIIGYEREREEKPVGMRTHAVICVGSALFTVAGLSSTGDPGRMAAGIVTGIGFLGAGAILRQGHIVVGLTTAASIWVVAGIGVAAGMGMYLISAMTTGIILIILLIPRPTR